MAVPSPLRKHAYSRFVSVLDQSIYEPLPGDWLIGMTDVVDSTAAIEGGQYKDVNFAGISIIAALGNAIGTFDFPFTFGGDGATFAVAPEVRDHAIKALRQVRSYAASDLNLSMRAGLVPIGEIRANGHDVRIARYAVSDSATYSMFAGGGIRWFEHALKSRGAWQIEQLAGRDDRPDLTGLKCDWNPFENRHGTILSLLIEPRDIANEAFTVLARSVIDIFDADGGHSIPVPEMVPTPRDSGRVVDQRTWAAVASNSDFRKYDDVLRLTVDCSLQQVNAVKRTLRDAVAQGEIVYGLHCQSHAIMTCLVPAASKDNHLHFLDGMDGGYAKAAAMLHAVA
ncbi:DUF3095 family protein [Rhizobium lusitanum]|uniref:DUF3095 family protein n=1 Tax=Rhizobium lusitanum TaxID=293958 RepID=UPI0032B2D33C